jgi:hypothetical protein
MKSVKFIAIALIAVTTCAATFAQTYDQTKTTAVVTETFKVQGNCEMCQTRIEKAAKISGVTTASWNKDTKILTLGYNPAAVHTDDILRKVAAVGHDNEKFKADDGVYNKLPACCKYRKETE